MNDLTPETVDTNLHVALCKKKEVLASMTADANPRSPNPKLHDRDGCVEESVHGLLLVFEMSNLKRRPTSNYACTAHLCPLPPHAHLYVNACIWVYTHTHIQK